MPNKTADAISAALILKVNSHRHGFNGRICEAAASFDCGAQEDFRLRFCAQGDDRCIHLSAFSEAEPHFYVDHGPGDEAFHGREDRYRGVLVFLAAQSHQGGVGIDDADRRFFAVGAYVVDRVREVTFRGRRWWRVDPARNEWARFLPDAADVTRARDVAEGLEPSKYVRRARPEDVRRVLRDLEEAHEKAAGVGRLDLERDRERALRFLKDVRERFAPDSGDDVGRRETTDIGGSIPRTQLDQLLKAVVKSPSRAVGGGAVVAHRATTRGPFERPPLPAPPLDQLETFFKDRGLGYKPELLERFVRGVESKGFVILAGPPGAGKSQLARLFPEAMKTHGARHLLVPVQPSWRTREDLFGYYNPINDTFVATPFTRFLCEAVAAAAAAETARRPAPPYFATLDEINLARPEEYLAEILSRSQTDGEDRDIELFPPDRAEEVLKRTPVPHLAARVRLPFNLYFVGTMNADGTGHTLTGRVLDRSAFIKVDVHLESVLGAVASRFPAAATKEVVDTLLHLHETLRRHGRAFGARATVDVLRYVDYAVVAKPGGAADGLDAAVLEQILPQLAFSALEEADLAAVADLGSALRGDREGTLCLLRSSGQAESWRAQLQSARDVSGQAL
jgi:energy-coupling factor transporter ATP-binding protein EcfA2